MSDRDGKKRKRISDAEETDKSLYCDLGNIPLNTRVNVNPPSDTGYEAPAKRSKCDGIAESKPKSNGLTPKSSKGETQAIKRKRDEDDAGSEQSRESCTIGAKKPKLDPKTGEDFFQFDDIPLTEIDSYFLQNLIFHRYIGKGCFGKVMLVSHATTGRLLAVKMVPKMTIFDRSNSQAQNEKLVLEIAAGSPFLCSSYATFQSEHHIFYVMDYMAGGDLDQAFLDKDLFSMDVVRIFTAELICGLEFLHSKGISHRDLHMGNIFIDSAGHCKIGDFGLTNINKKISGLAGLSASEASENFNKAMQGYADDWYMIGRTIYKMATGFPLNRPVDQMFYPKDFPPDIQDVIFLLLTEKDEKRMLFVQKKLQKHPMFATIDWMKFKSGKTSSLFHMKEVPAQDFNKNILLIDLLKDEESEIDPLTPEEQNLYRDFTKVNDRRKHLQ